MFSKRLVPSPYRQESIVNIPKSCGCHHSSANNRFVFLVGKNIVIFMSKFDTFDLLRPHYHIYLPSSTLTSTPQHLTLQPNITQHWIIPDTTTWATQRSPLPHEGTTTTKYAQIWPKHIQIYSVLCCTKKIISNYRLTLVQENARPNWYDVLMPVDHPLLLLGFPTITLWLFWHKTLTLSQALC